MVDSSSGNHKTEKGGSSTSSVPANGDMFGRVVNGTGETEGKRLAFLVEWLNSLLPDLGLPETASYEDLRSVLINGTILCRLLNRLRPCSVDEVNTSDQNSVPSSENVASPRRDLSSHGFSSPLTVEERQKVLSESKYQCALRSPVMSEPSAGLMHHVGHKFHEVFQIRQRCYTDLPAAKISEMMKSNSLDNAPTQSLLSVVNGILDECVERNNSEIPHRVACLLRKYLPLLIEDAIGTTIAWPSDKVVIL